MGFSWTPFVGQAIAFVVVLETAKRLHVSTVCIGESAVPPWTKWLSSGGTHLANVVVWADNIIVVCRNRRVADSWRAALDGVCRQMGVVVKSPGFECCHGVVNFNGVQWHSDGDRVMWRHLPDNVEAWRTGRLGNLVRYEMAARDLAGWLGVLYWNWYMSGEPLGAIRRVVGVSRELAMRAVGEGGSWDFCLRVSHFDYLCDLWELVLRNDWNVRSRSNLNPSSVVFCASDSSSVGGAGVRWRGEAVEEVFRYAYSDVERRFHINWKETFIAVRLTREVLLGMDRGSRLVVGVDNMTACRALRVGFFPGDERLSECCWGVHEEAGAKDIDIVVVHVPGLIQAADEGSRGKSLDVAKSGKCLEWLRMVVSAGSGGSRGPGQKRLRDPGGS